MSETRHEKAAAAVGMHITAELKDKSGDASKLEFDIVADKQSDFSAGRMSDRAPLAQAILGHAAGETVEFVSPSGAIQTVTILSVAPSAVTADAGVGRASVLDEALDKIARRESRQIALTAELHYGSMNPDGIKED